MWKKFLKKSGWTDIIISLIFVLLGILMLTRPNEIMGAISILLGLIFIVMGILKLVDYFSGDRTDNYMCALSIILIIVGIIIMFCSEFIMSAFRVIIAIWIIYSGIMNLQTTIVWKDYKSKLWLATLILAIVTIIAGIYILVNTGSVIQTIGIATIIYGIIDIIENAIFIKKVDDYLE